MKEYDGQEAFMSGLMGVKPDSCKPDRCDRCDRELPQATLVRYGDELLCHECCMRTLESISGRGSHVVGDSTL